MGASHASCACRGRARGNGEDRSDFLRNVLLALFRFRTCAGWQAVEVRGQSARPAESRPPVPARHRCRRLILRSRPPAEATDSPRRTRQGGVDRRHLGRGVHLHRGPDEPDQGAARPRVGGNVQPWHRPVLPPACAEVLGRHQLRRILVRTMPRSARCRFQPDIRHRPRLARARRHREHQLPRADRRAPGREHAQHPGAGIRPGSRTAHSDHRRRPALLGRGEQGQVLAADPAGHRPRAAARLVQRDGQRGPLRQGLRREAWPRLRPVRRRNQSQHA